MSKSKTQETPSKERQIAVSVEFLVHVCSTASLVAHRFPQGIPSDVRDDLISISSRASDYWEAAKKDEANFAVRECIAASGVDEE